MILLVLLCAAVVGVADDGTTHNATELLATTREMHSRLLSAQRAGLIEIAPVNLPVIDSGDCNHLGWPVATMTGDTMIVMHRRIPGHKAKGAGKPDPAMSYGIVLRSSDGGQSWSKPYDLRDCMNLDDRDRGGIVPLSHRMKFDPGNTSPSGYKVHLHSIGTASDGAVVAINNHGVFRSEDAGKTWEHFSEALRDDTFGHEIINLGPRIIEHPDRGLVAFGNWFGEVDSYHKLSNRFVAIASQDRGATWTVEEYDVGFPQYEPAAMLRGERVLLVSRDQSQSRAHKQIEWTPGKVPAVIDTNLSDAKYVDTVDFSYNPVTKRYEVVRSERHHMELWLWSMAPDDWELGRWRRECRLLASEGKFYETADGFHPAASIMDTQRGVQHIFVYAGHPNGPAGVFRITRSLETPKLAMALGDGNLSRTAPAPAPLTNGGVLFTFDDRNFEDWIKALPIFEEFGVRATFFISGKIDNAASHAIDTLTSHGHAIGSHSLNHLRAVQYCQQRSTTEFISNEIRPQIEAFQNSGVTPSSFAYPMSNNDDATDDALLGLFRHVRTGRNLGEGERLSESDLFFVPADQIAEHGCLYAKGIDFAPTRPDRTYEQIESALERAAKNDEIIVFYAHRITEQGNGNFITPQALMRIFSKVKALGLICYTFDELP